METIDKISKLGFIGTIGGFTASLFGGWSTDLVTLLMFMVVDYIMGISIALSSKSPKTEHGGLQSGQMFRGLVKKGIMLTIVLVAHRLDLLLGFDFVRTAAIISFIVNELISMVENAGTMGVTFPPAVVKAIEVLSAKTESNKKGESDHD